MVYITGDTHGAFDIHKINPREFTAAEHLTKDDYVIICGDFGCIWDGGSSDRFWLNWLETLPWNTLFIDGNHENFDVLNSFPEEEWHGGKVHKIRDNIFHLKRGEIFDIDGHSYLAFGGAFSHDASLREENKNWWKEEIPTAEEAENAFRNLEKHDWKVDYILTHDIFKAHPLAKTYPVNMDLYNEDQKDIQEVLQEIHEKTDYRKWFHGHYHKDLVYEAQEKPEAEHFALYDNILELNDFDSQKHLFQEIDQDTPFTIHDFEPH